MTVIGCKWKYVAWFVHRFRFCKVTSCHYGNNPFIHDEHMGICLRTNLHDHTSTQHRLL